MSLKWGLLCHLGCKDYKDGDIGKLIFGIGNSNETTFNPRNDNVQNITEGETNEYPQCTTK